MKKILLGLAFTSAFGANAQITNNLQAEYLLDGNIEDSHNSNDLTSPGGFLTYGSNRLDQSNSSYDFNGSSELISPVDLSAMQEKSISLWFITDQPGGLIGHDGVSGNAPILYIGSDEKLKGKFWDGSQGSVSSSNTILTDSVWHHVVITAGPSGQRAYLDNQLVGTTNVAPVFNANFVLDNTTIGYVIASSWPARPNNEYFSGSIDDVRIYDTIISPSIVNELYNTPVWQSPYDLDTLYVNKNATGANNGSSWADAYTDARDAFINTTPNSEIWIAQGVYKRNSSDRNTVFGWIKDSVRVFGGFVGNETDRNQRDWNANPTVFTGDIGVANDSSDNVYTVFVGGIGGLNYQLIDGIKITGGNSSEDSYPNVNTVGGGITLDSDVNLTEIKNVEFYNNYAKQGAAISVYGFSGDDCKIILENVVAHNNRGKSSAFGHFRASNQAGIEVEMKNCLIHDNEAIGTNEDFGTVLILGSNANINNVMDASITNCTFANNTYNTGNLSKGMIRIFNQTNAPSTLNFTNNISYGNNIIEITSNNRNNVSQPFPTIDLNNNILENGIDFTASVENSTLTSDPLFNTGYTLQVGSPAIDAGTQVGIIPSIVDLAGNNRVFGTEIDLGPFEYGASAGPTSIAEETENQIIVYPNPTNGVVHFKTEEQISSVEVYNLQGQLVEQFMAVSSINISHLIAGVYLVNYTTESGSKLTQQLIKR